MISGHPDLREVLFELEYPRNSKLFNQKMVNHIAPCNSLGSRWRGNWRVVSLFLPSQIFIEALFENFPAKSFSDFSVLHIFYFLRLQLFIPKELTQTFFLSHILYNKLLKKKKGTISYSSQILFVTDVRIYSFSLLKMSLFLHLLICDDFISCFEQQKMVLVLLQKLQT